MSVATKFKDLVAKTRVAGDEIAEGIEAVRTKVRATKGEQERVNRLPCTKEVALLRMGQWAGTLSSTADRNMPAVRAFAGGVYREPPKPHSVDLLLSFLWPQMFESFRAGIDKAYETITDAIAEPERQAQLEKIERDLLDLEMAEESLIRAAEQSGFPVQRRPDADPRAVLADQSALA